MHDALTANTIHFRNLLFQYLGELNLFLESIWTSISFPIAKYILAAALVTTKMSQHASLATSNQNTPPIVNKTTIRSGSQTAAINLHSRLTAHVCVSMISDALMLVFAATC